MWEIKEHMEDPLALIRFIVSAKNPGTGGWLLAPRPWKGMRTVSFDSQRKMVSDDLAGSGADCVQVRLLNGIGASAPEDQDLETNTSWRMFNRIRVIQSSR